MPPKSAHPFVIGERYRNGNGAYEVLAIEYPSMRVRYDHGQIETLSVPIQQRIHDRLVPRQEPRWATGGASTSSAPRPRGGVAPGDAGCQCCRRGTPTTGPRECPECGHTFRGNNWEGIDAHWRSHHEGVMPYEAFWQTMCPPHRAGRD